MEPERELTQAVQGMVDGVTDLWRCLASNQYPQVFLEKVLGLSQADPAWLTRRLLALAGAYFLCAGATLWLRLRREQRSLSGWSTQVNTAILTLFSFVLVPLLVLFVRLTWRQAQAQADFQGSAWERFSNLWTAIFPFLFTALVLLFTLYMPLRTVQLYWKAYRLAGLPHAAAEVGLGPLCLCAALLSMARGNRLWYALLLPALLILALVQRGGYIPQALNRAPRQAAPGGAGPGEEKE